MNVNVLMEQKKNNILDFNNKNGNIYNIFDNNNGIINKYLY